MKLVYLYLIFLLSFPLKGEAVENITVYGKKENSFMPQPDFADSIDIENMDRTFQSLGDILRSISGITIKRTYGTVGEFISIRGFKSNQVKVLINDIPLTQSGSSSIDLNQIPISDIKQIIVYKGPMAAIYGGSAMGGVVNVITKKRVSLGSLAIGTGSYQSKKLEAEYTQYFDGFDLSLIGGTKKSNQEYQISDQETLKNNEIESKNVTLIANTEYFVLDLKYFEEKKGIPGTYYNRTFHIEQRKSNKNVSLYSKDIEWNDSIISKISYDYKKSDLFYEDPIGEINSFPEEVQSNQEENHGSFQSKFDYDRTSLLVKLNLQKELFVSDAVKEKRITKLYSFLNITKIHKFASLHLSYSRSNATNLSSMKSYGVDLILKDFIPNFSIYARHGYAFRYPTFSELYLEKGFVVGNNDLQPEKTRGNSFGLKYYNDIFDIELAYYKYLTLDLIDYLLVSGFQYKPFNYARSRSTGGEVSIAVSPLQALDIKGRFSSQHVKDDLKESDYYNNYIPGNPISFGSLSMQYQLMELYFKLVWEYSKENFVNKANTKKLKNYELVNFSLGSESIQNLVISADINNILDKEYADIRGFPIRGREYFINCKYLL